MGFLRRFRNESGAVAIWFAVLALPLAVLSFGLIDVNRASVEKRYLQDALDAATLLAARSTAATDSQLQSIGAAAMAAQLSGSSQAKLTSTSFTVVGTKITGTAVATVKPVIANLWLKGDMTVGAKAEVIRASTNLEVAVVLDITGSMSGSRITDLKTAATDLIDMVVSDVQTPYYSKAAIVPYSVGVNVGAYAASARGAVTAGKTITAASWATGTAKTITGSTKANPVVITSNGHGFSNGDVVWITGVKGMTQLNDRAYTVANKSTNSFQLSGVNGSSYSTYSSAGTVQKCQVSDCSIVITSTAHGFNNGDRVQITGVNGMTQINNTTFTVANKATNTFSLSGVNGAGYGTYSSGGTAYCVMAGCQYYEFTSATGSTEVFGISTCVTERIGLSAATDVAPSGSPVGRNYPSTSNPCPSASITPLTSDKVALKSQINSFSATGSTAGQIGVAWGWFMVSPNFAYLWPSGRQPAAYGTKELVKAVVIMTDGDFNTPYCNGVIAKNAGTGSGSSSDKINCNATNGDPVSQALTICTNMKAKGVVVYTVGFDVDKGSSAETLMKGCATSTAHVYLPSSGGALKDAFAAIGRDIMKLRLSK
ncbi:MAG: ubiquitin-activating E1 FCCH domain-containing protein [Caulobacter sp.]|nr:ubiquitin-activating E1 FCCH domain-containing protein [Caulobacter sp.]